MKSIEKLNQYHAGQKVRVGIEFLAATPEPAPKPIIEDPTIKAQKQIAMSYWDMAQALRGI